MSTRFDEASSEAHESSGEGEIPEISWREAGWIFTDGDAQAIERQGTRSKGRAAPASDVRDE